MACPANTPRTMHQDTLLLTISTNKKRKNVLGKKIRISELKVFNGGPANILCPKMVLINSQKIISIIGKLRWGKQADNLLDRLMLHKSKPVIEYFRRYVGERKSGATPPKNNLFSLSGSPKTGLWICYEFG